MPLQINSSRLDKQLEAAVNRKKGATAGAAASSGNSAKSDAGTTKKTTGTTKKTTGFITQTRTTPVTSLLQSRSPETKIAKGFFAQHFKVVENAYNNAVNAYKTAFDAMKETDEAPEKIFDVGGTLDELGNSLEALGRIQELFHLYSKDDEVSQVMLTATEGYQQMVEEYRKRYGEEVEKRSKAAELDKNPLNRVQGSRAGNMLLGAYNSFAGGAAETFTQAVGRASEGMTEKNIANELERIQKFRDMKAEFEAAVAAGKEKADPERLAWYDAQIAQIEKNIEGFTEQAGKTQEFIRDVNAGADLLAEASARQKEAATEGLGTVGTWLVNAGTTSIESGLDFLASGFGVVPTKAIMAVRVFGNAAAEARRSGADESEQLFQGAKQAAIEWASEMLFGGNPIYDEGGGLVTDAVYNVLYKKYGAETMERLFSTMAAKIAKVPLSMAGEGIEEVLSDYMNPLVDAIANEIDGKERDASRPDWQTVRDDFVVGAIAGGLGQVTQAGIQKVNRGLATRQAGRTILKNKAQQALEDYAAEVGQDVNLGKGRAVDLGRAFNQVQEAYTSQAVENRLAELGAETSPALTEAVKRMAEDKALDREQQAAYFGAFNEARQVMLEYKAAMSGNVNQDNFWAYDSLIRAEDLAAGTREDTSGPERTGEDRAPAAEPEANVTDTAPSVTNESPDVTNAAQSVTNTEERVTEPAAAVKAEMAALAQEEYIETAFGEKYRELTNRQRESDDPAEREALAETLRDMDSIADAVNQAPEEQQAAVLRDFINKVYGGNTNVEEGTGISDADGRRDAGAGAAVEGGNVAAGTERARGRAPEQIRTATERQNAADDLRLAWVSTQEMGLDEGTEDRMNRVLPESAYDEELRSTAADIRERTGREPVFVLGPLRFRTADGGTFMTHGVNSERGIYIQADHHTFTARQIGDHELYHEYAADNPGLNSEAVEKIRERFTENEFDVVAEKYIKRLRGRIDMPADADEITLENAMMEIYEEILADAYAGVNAFGGHAEKFQEAVRESTEARGVTRSEDGKARGSGGMPGARYILRSEYADEVQAWYDSTKETDRTVSPGYFDVGATSDALKSIGVRDGSIYFRKSKIGSILEDHPDMDIDIIKQVPNILENPVLVMKSKTRDDSIVLFGDVRTKNGDSVMAAMELTPKAGGGSVAEFSLVSSAYERTDDSIRNLLSGNDKNNGADESEILYIDPDKNRADTWLMQLRVQFPSRQPSYGSIGTITYENGKVKIAGKTLSELGGVIGKPSTAAKQGPRYMYAGEKSQTADTAKLSEAQEMEERGESSEDIRQATGWFKGMDGLWRYEIGDERAAWHRYGDAAALRRHPGFARHQALMEKLLYGTLTAEEESELRRLDEIYGRELNRLSGIVEEGNATLNMVLDHPALYEAYPELRKVRVRFVEPDGKNNGSYNPRNKTIEISEKLRNNEIDLMRTLLHEVQHAVQSIEGFARGSSLSYWGREGMQRLDEAEGYEKAVERELEAFFDNDEYLQELERRNERGEINLEEYDRLSQKYLEGSEEYKALEKQYQDAARERRFWERKVPGELYEATAGEIEARDTANRRRMTDEQRKNTRPDIDREDVVFADDAEESYSIERTRDMPWEYQVRGYFTKDGSIRSSDSLYLGTSENELEGYGVPVAPEYIPTSVISKAVRSKKGSRSAHELTEQQILDIQKGKETAPAIIINPERNAVVYITENKDNEGNYIVAAFDLNNDLYGENAHKATSIHGQKTFRGMLDGLGEDARILVRNKNKFDEIAGLQTDQPPKLLATIELIGDNVSQKEENSNTKITGLRSRFDDLTEADRQTAAQREGKEPEQEITEEPRKQKYSHAAVGEPSPFTEDDLPYVEKYIREHRAVGEAGKADVFPQATAAAEKQARLRSVGKEGFKGTKHLEALGVKIASSVGEYRFVESMAGNAKAAKTVEREVARAERRLQPTEAEKRFAAGIADGTYTLDEIPRTMNADTVEELADYYWAERGIKKDTLQQQRRDIGLALEEKMAGLFTEGKGTAYKPSQAIILNNRTPERNMRHIFGDKHGTEVYEEIFAPVAVNEAERFRFINRMFDEVRTFRGKDGRKSELTKEERALVQMVIEGKAVEETVAGMEIGGSIRSAAENIRNAGRNAKDGKERIRAERDALADSAREFGLRGEERKLAEKYARWLEAQEALEKADTAKVENAAKKYSEMFDKFYDAINDFLVAHGYEPIGYIKGYAPHLQPEANQNRLENVFKALGIDTNVTKLPSSIAGLTADYKPNKRWNPYFLQRKGDLTDYDIAKAYESYVEYLSDVLYHTDDIMRVRAAVKHLRTTYAPEENRLEIENAMSVRTAKREDKEAYLRARGILSTGAGMPMETIDALLEEHIDTLLENTGRMTKYSDMTMWLDNYANILAGKQSMADRGWEYSGGRLILNLGNRLTNAFAKAQVAGNISSALNQSAQLPQIYAELGTKYTLAAAADNWNGRLRRSAWAQESDFLTGKNGINYLVSDASDMIVDTMFKPLDVVDGAVATLAVRGKYLKELDVGKAPAEAMRAADRFGEEIMGSRMKGSKPTAYDAKNPLSRMFHMFQLEAVNSWEHITQDLPRDFRQIERSRGREAAAGALAGVVIKTLLSAFVLNRLAEGLYGGTPAPFDLIGLSANFIASGVGLTTNEWLRRMIDNVMEKLTGKRLFGTDDNDEKEQFDANAAAKDLSYNVMNDIPFLRNGAALFGLGDNTLPIPDVYGGVEDIVGAIKNHGLFSPETGLSLVDLASEFMPGGRQINKTVQGVVDLVRGGRYYGWGDESKLAYPIDVSVGKAAQGAVFGPYALEDSDAYYSSDRKALSVKQTNLYESLVEQGVAKGTVYTAIQEYRAIDGNKDLGSYERGRQERELITGLSMTDAHKLEFYREMTGADSRAEKFQNMMDAGLSFAECMTAYDEYARLDADETKTAKEKATYFAAYVQAMDCTQVEKSAISENLKFYISMPIDTGKAESAAASGIDTETYLAAQEAIKAADAANDGNGNYTQAEVEAALRGMDLTDEERATLWQLANKSWKAEKNPFRGASSAASGTEPSTSAQTTKKDQTSQSYLDSLYADLKPPEGKEEVTKTQKYRAIIDNVDSISDQIKDLETEMSETEIQKIQIGYSRGVTPEMYVSSKEEMYARRAGDQTSQMEAKYALDGMDLTDDQKAVLWQLTNKSWKPYSNPYNTTIGEAVYDELHGAPLQNELPAEETTTTTPEPYAGLNFQFPTADLSAYG